MKAPASSRNGTGRVHGRRPVVIGSSGSAGEAHAACGSRPGRRPADRGRRRGRRGRERGATTPARCGWRRRWWRPSSTRMSGAGTLRAWPSSPNASTSSAGPSGPSGCQRPVAARSRSVTRALIEGTGRAPVVVDDYGLPRGGMTGARGQRIPANEHAREPREHQMRPCVHDPSVPRPVDCLAAREMPAGRVGPGVHSPEANCTAGRWS